MAIFGLGKKKEENKLYMLMNADSRLIARGELQSAPDARNMQFHITEGLTDDVVEAGILQSVSPNHKEGVRIGQVIYRRGNTVVLEPLRELGAEVRKNFRMPVDFETFVYPAGRARALAKSQDLSCSGIAFFSPCPLTPGEIFEIVIPITLEAPLLLHAEALRASPYAGPIQHYGARFVNLINDEEEVLREAVFSVQIKTMKKQKSNAKRKR